MSTTHVRFDSPVGPILVVGDETHVRAVWMGSPPPGRPAGPEVEREHAPAPLRDAATQLEEYFRGERQVFDLPLAPEGTDFQRRVWAQLEQIPYGQTRSYGQIAAAIGQPRASQAVGAANGRNPLSIVVPCHRVLGSTGALVGYAGGLERKQALLELERRVAGESLF